MTPRDQLSTIDDLLLARRLLDLEAEPSRWAVWLIYAACLLILLACWVSAGWLLWVSP
jgi:hypothetical protein